MMTTIGEGHCEAPKELKLIPKSSLRNGSKAIGTVFALTREQGRKPLIGFLTAGDPFPRSTPRLARALIDGGVDILELGIPFSDPIADGPTIQAADARSLAAGTTVEICLKIAQTVKEENEGVPIIFLTYFNPMFRFGLEKFLAKAPQSGVDGLVVPDLPEIGSEEFDKYKESAFEHGLSTILLATPTTHDERVRKLLSETNGFLYLVPRLGVTGARKDISSINLNFINHVSRLAKGSMHVAAGFGISKSEHVRAVIRAGADGVIVGSAFVNIVADNLGDIDSACTQLKTFAHRLRGATCA